MIYTGTGHESIDSNKKEELQLFINAMVAAANVTAVKPEVDFVDSLDPNADIESARYYATDQSSWRADDGTWSNVLRTKAVTTANDIICLAFFECCCTDINI